MKKKLFFKLFIFAVIGVLATMTSCKDYDEDISQLETELSALKSTVLTQAELSAVKTQLETSINQVKTDLAAVKTKADASASKAQLDAAMALVVKLETYNAYKAIVDADLAKLKTDLAKAATKEEVQAIKTTLESSINQVKTEYGARLANLEAILKIKNGKSEVLDGINLRLDDQLALINANATEIAAVKADLLAKYNELKALIDANKLAIQVLDAKVEAYKKELDQKIIDLRNELSDLIFDVYSSLDKRVSSLTFIPDYTSPDGTPQIVVRGITEWTGPKYVGTPRTREYWEVIQKNGTIYKGITILRYNVSPSNVSLNDFEVEQLVQKASLVRSTSTKSDYIVLSGDATLENGVLSVPVAVSAGTYDLTNGSWSESNGQNTPVRNIDQNISVALQVRNVNAEYDNDEDRIVTSSEYVKANFDLSTGRIKLNENSLQNNKTLPVDITYANIAGAGYLSDIKLWNGKSQSGNMTDVLNHTINLNDYIYGVFEDYYGDWRKMLDFGFDKHSFKFRLVPLGTEGVDQSYDYLNFDGTTGVIGVKPAGTTVNQAAVGRTPVVEVTAVVNGKVHAVGYIKIIVTDEFDNSPVNFEFRLDDFVLNCNATHQLTNVDINSIDFDQIFNHARIQLGKDAFFTEYNQNPVVVELISGPAGASASDITFTWAINPETQSVNLYNYLKGEISNQAPVGTYRVKTTLKSNGYRPDVVIYWTFKVVLPTGINLTPNQVYFKNGGIVINPSILEQGSKTSTVYEALLNNTFMHNEFNFDFGTLQGDQQCDEFLTPFFVFKTVPTGFYVSDNGTTVKQNGTGLLAAKIIQDGKKFYLHLNDQNVSGYWSHWGDYRVWSNAAKDLVKAGWVNVQPKASINGQPLNVIDLYDPFKVTFTYPLELILPTNLAVYDQANDGVKNKTSMDVNNPSRVKDWNGKWITFNSDGSPLILHYEISTPNYTGVDGYYAAMDFDFDHLTSNLLNGVPTEGVTNGPIPQGSRLKLDLTNSTTTNLVIAIPGDGAANADVVTNFVFEWTNSATGAVQNSFKVFVPVSLKHKWGTLNDKLVITINPGNGN